MKNNKNLYSIIGMTLLCVMFTGCSSKKKVEPPPPPNVTTAVIKQQDVPVYVDAIGQVIAPSTVYIRPQVSGKLMKAYFKQGALVKAGDILYEIDPRPYQALLDEAKAQLKHDEALLVYAENVVKRYKEVVEGDFVSVLNFQQYESNAQTASAQVDQDKAAIVAAQINVDFCHITAPVSGKISYLNVYVGNILLVDDPNQITTLLPLSPIDVTFSLPQQQFEMIRLVQGNAGEWKFIATLPEKPTQPFAGTSYFIDNQIDQGTGTILLKGRLPNEKLDLWPGEFIRVKVLYKMAPGAFTVPPSSVLMGKDGPYIYIIDDAGKAAAINVTVLTKTDDYIALQAPQLKAGQNVIVDGQINIAPGLMVKAVTNTPQ